MRTLTNAVVRSGSILQREAGRLFRPFGITAAHFNVLNMLAEDPAGVRATEITRYLVVDASSTTYTLDQLEELGWATRKRDTEDRRAIRIVLTPAGRKLHVKLLPIYRAALQELSTLLGAWDINSALPLLEKMPTAAVEAVDKVTQSLSATPAAQSTKTKQGRR